MKHCKALLSAVLLGLAIGLSAAEATKPNLVIFLSDDHTLLDSSVYGSKDQAMPSMARLAAEGLTFDRAFVVSPSCAPSRAALLTGLMPTRNGAGSLRVVLNGREVIAAKDNTYKAGTVGLRVVDTHASFRNLEIVKPSVAAP